MDLPNFLKDPDLNALRAQMGAAELGSFRLAFNVYRFTISDLEQSVGGGIVIDNLERVRVLADRTLSYKDRRVLLHLRDVHENDPDATLFMEPRPVFHCANCSTVRRMRESGTASQIVLAAREDGLFQIRVIMDGNATEEYERLRVCEACLLELQYNGFRADLSSDERRRRRMDFNVAEFFQRYGRNASDPESLRDSPAAADRI